MLLQGILYCIDEDTRMELRVLAKTLEDIRHIREDGTEYWLARELYPLLGYKTWRRFQDAVERARGSCITAGEDDKYHFADAGKMITIGSGTVRETEREVHDFELTRYACYLIAQNGDPRIPEIAFSQMYFAIQTRKQEVIEQNIAEIERLVARNKLRDTEREFAKVVYESGVDGQGIGEIRNIGDKVLFGGYGTEEMKHRLGLADTRKPLADVLPTVTIKAKDLATELTTFKTRKNGLKGKEPIKREHIAHNQGVRKVLTDSGVYPETLPAEVDIHRIESKQKSQQKLAISSKKSLVGK